ncbi:head GIN domain-containing protein [Chloroflexota bacterium]
MRKFLTLVAVILSVMLLLPGCYGLITGSGNLDTREFDYSDFNRLEVSSAFEVEIVQSASFAVSITTDDNIFEYIDIAKSGNTLNIRLKSGYNFRYFTIEAVILMPDITHLKLSGATHGTVQDFSFSHDLAVELSGASSLIMTNIAAGRIDFEISGASRVSGNITADAAADFDVSGASTVELSGSAKDLKADASGASHLELDDFPVSNADIELSGVSNGTVNTDGTLDADLSGASKLYYIGEPTMGNIDTSGASGISKK